MKNEISFVERAIAVISPQWGAERAAQRVRLDMITRSYDAGGHGRQTEGWKHSMNSSGNTEIQFNLVWLRERSRDLVRNNPYAKKALQVITVNTIGTGIKPNIPKDRLPKAQEKKLMDAWREWGETTECDYNGKYDFYGLSMRAWKTACEGGDAIIRIYRDASATVPIKLQLLESDYLDHQQDGVAKANGNYVLGGIEFNQAGKKVAYWIFKHHPGENLPVGGDLQSVRIPADQIIHLYEELRPGQVRGIPQGVASFMRLKGLDEYEDAQLIRQKIAACFSVFIRKTDPLFIENYNKSGETLDPLSEKVSPGIIDYLAPGEDVTFAAPPGVSGYNEYTRAILRAVAAGYGITYEALTGDLSNVNFSSGRMGWLEMHRQVEDWQVHTVIPLFCEPIWKIFCEAAKMRGIVQKTAIAEWTPPRRLMLDPVKEANGLSLQIRAGLISRAEAVRQLGFDPDVLLAEMISEQAEQDKAGMMLESDAKHDPQRVNFGKEAYLAVKTKAPAAEK